MISVSQERVHASPYGNLYEEEWIPDGLDKRCCQTEFLTHWHLRPSPWLFSCHSGINSLLLHQLCVCAFHGCISYAESEAETDLDRNTYLLLRNFPPPHPVTALRGLISYIAALDQFFPGGAPTHGPGPPLISAWGYQSLPQWWCRMPVSSLAMYPPPQAHLMAWHPSLVSARMI